MTRRFTSLTREERAALLDAKQSRFLERVAKALGPDPNSDTPSCFRQKRGRTAIPVVRTEGTYTPLKTAGIATV
jgi:hypothetical protein